MADIATLSESEVRSLVGPAEALAAMRTAFAALHRGEVTQPAIMDLEFPAVRDGRTNPLRSYMRRVWGCTPASSAATEMT